jgi:hypothetical protein
MNQSINCKGEVTEEQAAIEEDELPALLKLSSFA